MPILDASGKPVTTKAKKPDPRCPGCGSGPEKRVASSGFGVAHPVCSRCGHEWIGEVWRG